MSPCSASTPQDPERYGRLVTDGADLLRIVEYKDATEAERAITLCNSGVLACDADLLADLVAGLTNDNAAGEYYLTDVIAAARAQGPQRGLCDLRRGRDDGRQHPHRSLPPPRPRSSHTPGRWRLPKASR